MRNIVCIAAAAGMMMSLVGQAQALELDFYGNARVKTWWERSEAADGTTFADGDDKAMDFDMGLQSNSRLGARIKANDELSGLAEVAITESTVNLRHLIGHWNFGAGVLSIGQSQTPISYCEAASVYADDRGLLSFGEPWTGRRPMLQLAVEGLKIALVKPHGLSDLLEGVTVDDEEIGSMTENLMPRLELAYAHKVDMVRLDAFGGAHTYRIKTADKNYDVTSYMGGAGLAVNPGNVYLRGFGYYARNARQFGQALPTTGPYGSAKIVDGNLVDNDVFAAAFFANYSFTDRLKGEIGYGYSQSKDDTSGASTDKWQTYYAQANIVLTEGVFVVPEVGVIENRDGGRKTTYFGAKWQANF